MGLIERERIRKRVAAALKGEEYSVIEMAHDLERLATHPVWKQADQCAQDLEGAVGALEKIAILAAARGGRTDEERVQVLADIHLIAKQGGH
jgi:hypothetical protein